MRKIKITQVIEQPQLEISQDDYPESPREWSNLGYFITVDSDYSSPDDYPELKNIIINTGDEAESREDHMDRIKKQVQEDLEEKVLAIYPVCKYEHSGISYSLGSVHGFDFSNNGFYIITDKSIQECGTEKKYWERQIEAELEDYTKYVNGEVYRFILFDKNGDHADSCGGFYEIEDIRDHLPDEWKSEDLEEYIKY